MQLFKKRWFLIALGVAAGIAAVIIWAQYKAKKQGATGANPNGASTTTTTTTTAPPTTLAARLAGNVTQMN